MIRSPAIAALLALLAFVLWFGASVSSVEIEKDIATRTQDEITKHHDEIPNLSRAVDGRDVTVYGSATTSISRSKISNHVRDVWGVRVLDNNIEVSSDTVPLSSTQFNVRAEHNFPILRVRGQVDQPAYNLITNIHKALPPESSVDYSGLFAAAPTLPRSARIIETGIAAVTQLNPGTLTVTDEQFILEGTVFSEDRKKTVEQLINVRRTEIEPLEIIINISVESPEITQACQEGIDRVLANNVLNYAIDHFEIIDKHLSVLVPMVNTIKGVCKGQIPTILVEGHADYTGGYGYNQGLSERRSGTVRSYLIKHGIDPKLISAFGYGEFRPIASNETANGRAKNRRTEIYLLVQDQRTGETIPESVSTMNSLEQ
ncbi:OmpA family protein [Granulosicoccus sp.]|nr:OmpA family protein [Granulosicoccus sp.]MDB4224549.1 OmpA family protein [Granulosicoccus sp.]